LEYIRDRRKTINNELPPPIRRNGDSVCDEQVQLLCPDATGFGATARCIHDNWQSLSEPCHEFLRSLHDTHQNHPEHGGRHGRGDDDNDDGDHHNRGGDHHNRDGGHSNHHGDDGSHHDDHGEHDGEHDGEHNGDGDHHNNPEWERNGSLPAETIREQDMAIMVDCQDDIAEFCNAMNLSDIHGIEHCLRHYNEDLSRDCYETLQNTEAIKRHPDFHVIYIALIVALVACCCIRRRCKRREWYRRRQQQQQQQQQQSGQPHEQSIEMKDMSAVYNPAPQSPLSASYSNLAVSSAAPYTGTSYEPLPINEH